MSQHEDPNGGGTAPRSAALEALVVVGSLILLGFVMWYAVDDARAHGRPLGLGGFVELFFRESLLLGGVVVCVVVGLFLQIWRILKRIAVKRSMR